MLKTLQIAIALILACAHSASWAGKPIANNPPTVSLTSPISGASFVPPATIAIAASASDTDGTISKVDFYQGRKLIGTKSVAPYTVTWSGVAAGSYSLTAKATDNAGATKTSTAVSISVGAPKIIFSSPIDGTAVYGASTLVAGTFIGDANTKVWVDNGSSTRLATLNGNNFSATLPLLAGLNTFNVSVVRTDKTSDAGSVAITRGEYPQIAFTSPSTSTFTAPANITLAVDAVSPSSTIEKVNFLHGGTLLSSISSGPPYQYIWNNVPTGSYTVTAQAVDSLGYSNSLSTSIAVVGPNALPSVSIASPANNATFAAPANIAIAVDANDSDGTITKVEILKNGALFGVSNAPPYTFNWTNVLAGSYSLTARATDNQSGVSTSAPVNVTVSATSIQPTISLTSPTAGATFDNSATIALAASAVAGTGATVAQVEFFQGTTLIGTALTPPYTADWPNVAPGNYSLTAKVTDSLGATTVSAPVTITVLGATEFGISSPQSGTSFVAPAGIKLTAVNVAANIAGGPEFYKMSSFGGDPILIGGATSSDGGLTYTYLWSAGTAGTYTIKASQWVYLYGQNQLPTQFWSQPVTLTVTPNPDPATITYLHNDLSGSPIAATDANGTVIWKEGYQPYGGRVRNETAAADNRQFYTGKPFDADTGLSYFGARYFDPVSGRFMGVDPQELKADNIHSFNRYGYANNNPYKFVDPDGRSPRLLWLAGEASYYVATRFGARQLGSAIGIELYNVLHQESAGAAPPTPPADGAKDGGCIYCVKGDNTNSGHDYIGSTDNLDQRKRDKTDGRNREGAQVVDTYPKGDRDERRKREQQAINDHGGVDALDNKRNEVRESKWQDKGITPP